MKKIILIVVVIAVFVCIFQSCGYNDSTRDDAGFNYKRIADGGNFITAINPNGTLYFAGENINYKLFRKWKNMESIRYMDGYIVGLKRDGKVLVNKEVRVYDSSDSDKYTYQFISTNLCDDWENIVDIDNGGYIIAGLKSDGTVCVAYDDSEWNGAIDYERELWRSSYKEWKNIVSIAVLQGAEAVIGVTNDGTILYCADDGVRVILEELSGDIQAEKIVKGTDIQQRDMIAGITKQNEVFICTLGYPNYIICKLDQKVIDFYCWSMTFVVLLEDGSIKCFDYNGNEYGVFDGYKFRHIYSSKYAGPGAILYGVNENEKITCLVANIEGAYPITPDHENYDTYGLEGYSMKADY